MSRSPYFFVERFDERTGKYELQHPIVWNYNHTKQERADLFPYNGCHDLFAIVEERSGFPKMKGIHYGLPSNSCEEIIKAYDNCSYEYEFNGVTDIETPKVRWFTYADMYIYFLEHPTTIDYEATDDAFWRAEEGEKVETILSENPIMRLKKRVDSFLEVMDEWNWENDYSFIRIVYWIN